LETIFPNTRYTAFAPKDNACSYLAWSVRLRIFVLLHSRNYHFWRDKLDI